MNLADIVFARRHGFGAFISPMLLLAAVLAKAGKK